ncbi:hypothetical protein FA95DRAFT_1609797 [Auriscalpium vulgare]|uniref:Uncharacterized protein n=1 Tax=Auriscalpium vulgare TaxID=40419 RepID=A0ACB8RH75_9AGAM|nr:hypothetical protein FA95DRAFT_1609797 [Auriscalpium vulgare]
MPSPFPATSHTWLVLLTFLPAASLCLCAFDEKATLTCRVARKIDILDTTRTPILPVSPSSTHPPTLLTHPTHLHARAVPRLRNSTPTSQPYPATRTYGAPQDALAPRRHRDPHAKSSGQMRAQAMSTLF